MTHSPNWGGTCPGAGAPNTTTAPLLELLARQDWAPGELALASGFSRATVHHVLTRLLADGRVVRHVGPIRYGLPIRAQAPQELAQAPRAARRMLLRAGCVTPATALGSRQLASRYGERLSPLEQALDALSEAGGAAQAEGRWWAL